MGKLNGHDINVTINNKRVTKLAVNGKTALIHNLHVPARAGNKPDVPSDNTR
ncbi:hypothetical protein [Herbiconiux daphne]|uniref:Uncharacterized protein n=1 Tax=Herbiconiux daphne TaxID=2970914 RepID=A0ABT2H949_9MICO|nr:hypothetical protein [Herbiconiux daphne]MCS5736480.1 hypothetical protein [Herbiconiux daphne]